MASGRQVFGARAEAIAAEWYIARGYEVLERNWRCPYGELDLVLRKGRQLVVCEVKARSSSRFGVAAEAVTPTKQRRIRRATSAYLAALPPSPGSRSPRRALRFDVACVEGDGVEVIEAAF